MFFVKRVRRKKLSGAVKQININLCLGSDVDDENDYDILFFFILYKNVGKKYKRENKINRETIKKSLQSSSRYFARCRIIYFLFLLAKLKGFKCVCVKDM